MKYENLPIYKSAMELCVYVESIVRGFEKYHKYTIGADLREYSKQLLFAVHHANMSNEKYEKILALRDRCEEMKMLIQLGKELKALGSFKQFEHLSRLSVEVCRQAQAWLNHYAGVAK